MDEIGLKWNRRRHLPWICTSGQMIRSGAAVNQKAWGSRGDARLCCFLSSFFFSPLCLSCTLSSFFFRGEQLQPAGKKSCKDAVGDQNVSRGCCAFSRRLLSEVARQLFLSFLPFFFFFSPCLHSAWIYLYVTVFSLQICWTKVCTKRRVCDSSVFTQAWLKNSEISLLLSATE